MDLDDDELKATRRLNGADRSENDICVGEYVRTNKGIIYKIKDVNHYCSITLKDNDEDITETKRNFYATNGREINIEDIKAHSPNIIDLIQVNDILKIEISKEWTNDEDRIKIICVGPTFTIKGIIKDIENGLYKIKSVVTHEMFSSMQYIVKED